MVIKEYRITRITYVFLQFTSDIIYNRWWWFDMCRWRLRCFVELCVSSTVYLLFFGGKQFGRARPPPGSRPLISDACGNDFLSRRFASATDNRQRPWRLRAASTRAVCLSVRDQWPQRRRDDQWRKQVPHCWWGPDNWKTLIYHIRP